MTKTKNKKSNIFSMYFSPFGIRQICDILMFVGSVLAIVGAFTVEGILLAGLIVFLVGNVTILVKEILVLVSKINRKSPEYRKAIQGSVIMGAMFLVALFGLIYYFVA